MNAPAFLPQRPAVLALFAWAACFTPARAQEPRPDAPELERQVDARVAQLSLEEKAAFVGGVDNMFIRAEPGAGFPRLKMSDGPEGVRTWGPSTAYAGGIALAAAWDPELARRMGEAIGDDARARGVHILLAPGVNIYRAPMNGRNFEYLGEDPWLAARTAVGYIEGVQSRGVVATVKHFAANNSEYDRHNLSSDVDERTLREIYLPAFEAAVREAGVGAVMDAYNLVNGTHATENPWLNLQVLKKEWGFGGVLMSDWEATYDGVAAANAGLDLEMPRARAMTPDTLMAAVRSGLVSPATLDDKVRRIFRLAARFGFLERPQADPAIPLYSQEGRAVALDEARESMVLLRNQGSLLPLEAGRLRTLAVIGPDAWPAVPGGGGSSQVAPYRTVDFLTGISDYLGPAVRVLYARGLPTPEEFFQRTAFDRRADGQPPVKVEVFDNADFRPPTSAAWRMEKADGWRAEMWTPKARRQQTERITANFTPKRTGNYLFLVGAGGEDRYAFYVGGRKLIEQPVREGQAPAFVEVALQGGRTVELRMDYLPYSDHLRAGFGVLPSEEVISPEAKAIAAQADAAVVCAGFDPPTEREGYDRTFTLPWGQDRLIAAVAAANPRTIVTLTSGGGVDMRGWIDEVPAVLQTWYSGQEGGRALAEILFGRRSPEGKLPASFERSWDDNPTHDHYYPPPYTWGSVAHVTYGEGVFLGYRYYTSSGKRPLFPFGFGLSYTTFAFSHLTVSQAAGNGTSAVVEFDVTNTGSRPGAEVAQVYVGDPSAKLPRPARELKGFRKVRLDPGQTAHVSLPLDRRSFAYFDAAAHQWRIDPGKFVIYVGDSSEAAPLSQEITVDESAFRKTPEILFGP